MSDTPARPAVGDRIALPGGTGRIAEIHTGRLGSDICRLELDGGGSAFLKTGDGEAGDDLAAEFERLSWLRGRLPVPAATLLDGAGGGVRLLVDGIAGAPAHLADAPRAAIVDALAAALRAVHAVDTRLCPFRDTLTRELAEAERRTRLDKIDLAAFAAATGGLRPAQALAELERRRDIVAETLFTHGDYCLPNVLLHDGRVAGIIDWGIAGVADPHRDFMAIRDSLAFNFGPQWPARFFDAYGLPEPDEERLAYYTLLDQFFAHYLP